MNENKKTIMEKLEALEDSFYGAYILIDFDGYSEERISKTEKEFKKAMNELKKLL